jgi:hypothetical protein
VKRPWRRNDEDAKRAIDDAQRQHDRAEAHTPDVDAVALAAHMLTRRSDRFVAEIEMALRRPR